MNEREQTRRTRPFRSYNPVLRHAESTRPVNQLQTPRRRARLHPAHTEPQDAAPKADTHPFVPGQRTCQCAFPHTPKTYEGYVLVPRENINCTPQQIITSKKPAAPQGRNAHKVPYHLFRRFH